MYRFTTNRRGMSIVAAAALLASLTAVTVAGPTAAADEITCKGKVATIAGTQGDDVLVGTPGRDIIAGLGGDDVIKGLGGHDLICAGRGADRVKGNQGRDRIYGNAGPDKLFGGKGPDTLEGGVSDDWLKGQKGDDSLAGGPGTDTCYQDLGSGSEMSCELPAAPVVAPPALGDKDGDGVTDDVDACPNEGDQGYGLDGTGCPKPPANGWQAKCVTDGGAYEEDWTDSFGTTYPWACTWADGTSPYHDSSAMNSAYYPICFDELGGNANSADTNSDPNFTVCWIST